MVALAVAMLLVTGCGRTDSSPESQKPNEPAAVRCEVERGPVRVAVEVRPAKARLSDEPTLTLTIASQPGVRVRKPPFGDALGDFLIRDFREELPRLEGGREVLRQVYTLEPTRTGTLSILPISISFVDRRPGQSDKEQTLSTEALTVAIASVVQADVPSLDKLRSVAGPVELPPQPATAWWLALLLLPAVLGVGVWIWRRRRRRPVDERPLSPREVAGLELERLAASGLAGRDVKEFYVALTAIVRRYLEQTTGIRAPEQTTEEFLREIGRRETFPADQRRRLGDFLESADLVKFAAHRPRAEDIQESLRRAKALVEPDPTEVAA